MIESIQIHPTQKLCVCGRSKNFPICDNTHESEGWTCAVDVTWSKFGFCASYRYQNLARKLASHYEGALVLPGEHFHRVDVLATIVDGTDLAFPKSVQPELSAKKRIIFSLGTAGGLLQTIFPASEIVHLGQITVFDAFKQIRNLLDGGQREATPTTLPQVLPSAFVSHAVSDEPLLMPVIDYLRHHFQADLFLCADSIQTGSNWQDTIYAALEGKDQFVVTLSEATLASHFCSFEIGMAFALKKPIMMLSLDGSRPFSFVQHIQAVNLPRIAKQKPWLTLSDILLDELLRGLLQAVKDE